MPRYAYMPGGAIAIASCPRSGSSLKSLINYTVHGEDMFLGYKFPEDERERLRKEFLEHIKKEHPERYDIKKYLTDLEVLEEQLRIPEEQKDMHDLNPDGFWEMLFTVKGLRYYPHMDDLFKEFNKGKIKFCKIVSQGLLPSNPLYLKKILYSIRHPRAVAKSQERLVRAFNYKDKETGEVKNAFNKVVVHTPIMFVNVTASAAAFLRQQKKIPVLFTHFEDLISNPKECIDRMGEFVGFGDYTKAYDIVKPSLNRSQHEEDDSPIWEDADFVYENFCEAAALINDGNRKKADKYLKDIVDYVNDSKREVNLQQTNWFCTRARRKVNHHICTLCQTCKYTKKNMRNTCSTRDPRTLKHWALEPCVFECGFDVFSEKPLSIEESIERNHWIPRLTAIDKPPSMIAINQAPPGTTPVYVENPIKREIDQENFAKAYKAFDDIMTTIKIEDRLLTVKALDTEGRNVIEEGEPLLLFVADFTGEEDIQEVLAQQEISKRGGVDEVPDEVYQIRYETCMSNLCGKFRYIPGKSRCNACSCKIEIKARKASASCPYGFWDLAEEEEDYV